MMRAIVYTRVSTDAQERDGTSLETQERACVQLATQRGWDVVRCIRDAASGGALERDGLEELRGMLRRGDADVVLAYAVDRLSRNQNHIGILFDEFEQAGIQMEFVTERFEDTAVGRFILAARAFIAEVEREKIAERTMRGKEERARSGRIPQATGRGFFGYRYDAATGRRTVEETQSRIVRRAFEQFAGGASILGITNALNDEGVPSFTGATWSAWTVRNMLRNPAYAGRTIFRRTKASYRRDPITGKRHRVVETRDPSEWIEVPDATPAIVSDALFETVQDRLSDPERRRAAQRKYDYPLAGTVRCDVCEASMVGQTSLGKYRYYRCRRAYAGPHHDRCATRYVRATDLEDAVVSKLTDALSSPEVVLAELERAANGTDTDRKRSAARQRLTSLDKQHQRLLRLYQLGEVDDAYLEREVVAIRAQRASLEAAIDRQGAVTSVPLPRNPEEFASTCAALRELVLAEVEAGRLKQIAEAFQLSARIACTGDQTSGVLEGVIPHSFDEDFSHHCTNIGITTCTKRSLPTGRRTPGLEGDVVSMATRSVSMTFRTSVR